ncbi:MAG: glycosyltransferase family 2 protein [Clostridia bacterium]
MEKKLISVIVPCYCEEEAIPHYWEEMSNVADRMDEVDFEFLFIDDGSKDNTVEILRKLAKSDKRIRYVSFSRNFGKEAAMYAGLKNSKGDYVVIMDVDLQDPPSLLPEMLQAVVEEGYDCAATRRVTRKGEPPIRSFFARMFYKVMRRISKTDVVDGARDYRLMKRKMVNAILDVGEYNRFSKGIFGWVGFKTKWLEYENIERAHGETKWSFWKLLVYSIDGIVAFSTMPLFISSIIGIFFCVISFIAILVTIIRQLIWGGSAYGWSSMVCIILMLSGIQLFAIGILGQYLAKTYLEVKKRPIYIVNETESDNPETSIEKSAGGAASNDTNFPEEG